MDPIKKLREEQARVITEARSLNDTITPETNEADAAHIGDQVDRALKRASEIDLQIERETKLVNLTRSLDTAPDHRRPVGSDGEARGVDQGSGPTYREAFHAYVRAQGNEAALSPEVRAVLAGGRTTLEERAQTTTTNAAGAFTVPAELQNTIIRTMLMWGPMYDEQVTSQLVTASGNPLPFPTVNDASKTGAAAPAQGIALTDDGTDDAVFGQVQLDAFSYSTEWFRVSLELVNDSIFAMESLLGDLIGERLGRTVNSQLTVGTGTGAPNGIATASTLGVTAASATAVTSDEILNLIHSVDPAYRMSPKVAFMFNDATLAQIRRLKDGQGNYLWQMGNVQQGVPGSLLGYKYWINQAMATQAAAARSILFGDLGKYFVRKVGGPLIGAIQDKDFWPGFGMAGYIRVDGEMSDSAAIKYLRGL